MKKIKKYLVKKRFVIEDIKFYILLLTPLAMAILFEKFFFISIYICSMIIIRNGFNSRK